MCSNLNTITLPDGSTIVYQCDFIFEARFVESNLGGWMDPIGQVASWIVGQIRTIVENVLTGATWLWSMIVDMVWTRLRDAWDSLIRGINTTLGTLYNWLKDAVAGLFTVLDSIKAALGNVASWVWEKLKGAWDWILNGIYTFVSWIRGAVEWIWSNLGNVANWVWDKLRAAWDWILNGIYTFVSWIRGAVEWIWSNLGNVANWVWDKLRAAWDSLIKGIQTVANNIWGWIQDVGAKIWNTLQRIGAIVMDSVAAIMAGMFNLAKDFLNWIGQNLVGMMTNIYNIVKPGFEWILDNVKSGLLWVYNRILELAPKNLQEVPKKLPELIATMAIGGFGSMLIVDAASTKLFGSGLDFSGLRNFLGQVFSPGLVQGALLGAIVTSGIQPWVTRWVRTTFRTWLPELRDVFILWRQKYFTDFEKNQLYYQYGVPDGMEKVVDEILDYTPPISELMRVAQYTDVDLDWLKDKLIENGVTDRDIPYYQDMFLNASLRRVHSEIYSELEKSLSYGVPSRDYFSKIIESAKFRKFIQPYYLLCYDIVLARCRTAAWIDAWEEQLYKGLITPETFVERCINIGVDKEIAIARAMKQLARKGVYWEMPG